MGTDNDLNVSELYILNEDGNFPLTIENINNFSINTDTDTDNVDNTDTTSIVNSSSSTVNEAAENSDLCDWLEGIIEQTEDRINQLTTENSEEDSEDTIEETEGSATTATTESDTLNLENSDFLHEELLSSPVDLNHPDDDSTITVVRWLQEKEVFSGETLDITGYIEGTIYVAPKIFEPFVTDDVIEEHYNRENLYSLGTEATDTIFAIVDNILYPPTDPNIRKYRVVYYQDGGTCDCIRVEHSAEGYPLRGYRSNIDIAESEINNATVISENNEENAPESFSAAHSTTASWECAAEDVENVSGISGWVTSGLGMDNDAITSSRIDPIYHGYFNPIYCTSHNLPSDDDGCYYDARNMQYNRTCYAYADEKHQVIHRYNYTPTYIKHFCLDNEETNLLLGTEIEVDYGGESAQHAKAVLDIINKKSGDNSKDNSMNVAEDNMFCKHDGSLRNGLEFVTMPCSLMYHQTHMNYKEMFSYLIKNGYRAHDTTTCGLHVHVNRDYLGKTELVQQLTISKILYILEKFNDEICVIARRKRNNYSKFVGDGKDEKSVVELYGKYKRENKYVALNMQHKDTIEFRCFKGTLKYETYMLTLEFVKDLVDFARGINIEEIETIKWEDLMDTFSKELKDYYYDRLEKENEKKNNSNQNSNQTSQDVASAMSSVGTSASEASESIDHLCHVGEYMREYMNNNIDNDTVSATVGSSTTSTITLSAEDIGHAVLSHSNNIITEPNILGETDLPYYTRFMNNNNYDVEDRLVHGFDI